MPVLGCRYAERVKAEEQRQKQSEEDIEEGDEELVTGHCDIQ